MTEPVTLRPRIVAGVKRHHLVPQMVLRRFANSAGRIVMVSRDDPSRAPITTSIKNAAAEAGFYRIDTNDVAESHQSGHDPEVVEQTLAAIEGLVRPLLDNLARGRLPLFEERYRIAQFLALQHVRGPGFREDMNRLGTLAARDHLRQTMTAERAAAYLRQQGLAAGPADAQAFLDSALGETGPTLVMSQPHAMQAALRHAVEVVQPLVYFRAWHVLRFPDPVLLTSDTPVAVWSPPAPDGLPVGIANAAEVYLPVDRQTVLVVTDEHIDAAPDQVVDDPAPERAARVNAAVAANAHRWVFHHPNDTPLAKITLPSPSKWERESHSVASEPGGRLRVRGITVKRPRTG